LKTVGAFRANHITESVWREWERLIFSQGITWFPRPLREVCQMTPEQPELIKALQDVATGQKELAQALAAKPPGKDVWDKFGSLSIFLSSVIIAGVAALFTHEFDAAQVRISELTTLEKFIPHLASRDPNEQKLAIIELSALGDTAVAVGIAKLYPNEGTYAGLRAIAANGNSSDQALANEALRAALVACPVYGRGGDPSVNALKNRLAAPSARDFAPGVTTPADMTRLAAPAELKNFKMRADWPHDRAAQQVTALENKAVTIEGYLVHATKQDFTTSGASNCRQSRMLFDYHLYVSDQPGAGIQRAVVVKMTPRWRELNPSWGTPGNAYSGFNIINGLVRQRVRVTGWLLFNEAHLNEVGKSRATVWEVEPVTTFEYQKNGAWVAL
jgi:hypothetical protein